MTGNPRSAIAPDVLAVVAMGGAAGAGARWAIVTAVEPSGTFPWWTLLVNVVGCLLLGLLLGVPERTRLGLGVGFCGGLTTFSTLSVEVATLLDGGDTATAVAYVAASLLAGAVAIVTGWRLAPAL